MACSYDIVHRPGKVILQADFLSRYSIFSLVEKCSFIMSATLLLRDALRKFTKSHYSQVVSVSKKGWQPAIRHENPQVFPNRQESSIQPDGLVCLGDRLIIPPPLRKKLSGWIAQRPSWSGEDEVIGSVDVLMITVGLGRPQKGREL